MNDLERLVAIEGLRSLQARYVRYADAGDWRALAGLFLPDAQFTPYGMDGRPQMVMTGPAEIEQRVSGTVGSGRSPSSRAFSGLSASMRAAVAANMSGTLIPGDRRRPSGSP